MSSTQRLVQPEVRIKGAGNPATNEHVGRHSGISGGCSWRSISTVSRLSPGRLVRSGGAGAEITRQDRESTCPFVRRTLVRFRYLTLKRPEKGVVRAFLV